MSDYRILGICGSLRKKSTNLSLLHYAVSQAPEGVKMQIADLSDIPFYNSDLTDVPAAVQQLFADIAGADALMLACPEYNYSMAPALKNALDWASKSGIDNLLVNKPTGLLGAGGGMGTSRAQYHLRQVGVSLQLDVLHRPEIFCSAFKGTFDADNQLIDPRVQDQIKEQMAALVTRIKRL